MLDTDGVNAYAAPGGLVHITRGLLGLMKNEAELAGVLGHEITHVTAKHTVRAIQKSKAVSVGRRADEGQVRWLSDAVEPSWREQSYKILFENKFDRERRDGSRPRRHRARQQGRLRAARLDATS